VASAQRLSAEESFRKSGIVYRPSLLIDFADGVPDSLYLRDDNTVRRWWLAISYSLISAFVFPKSGRSVIRTRLKTNIKNKVAILGMNLPSRKA
jgi:hypothetical protein